MIQDSGTRREFDTGAVRDMTEGKGRFDLMPLEVVGDIMLTKTHGGNPDYMFILNIRNGLEERQYWSFINACADFIQLHSWSDAEAMLEVAVHFEEGAKKYGEFNWQKGIPISSYVDSALRHYFKWKRGDEDERHDRAVLWNLMCAAWTIQHREN